MTFEALTVILSIQTYTNWITMNVTILILRWNCIFLLYMVFGFNWNIYPYLPSCSIWSKNSLASTTIKSINHTYSNQIKPSSSKLITSSPSTTSVFSISMNNETLVHCQPLITSSIVSSTYYKKHTNDNHLISFHHLDSSMIQSKFETIYNSHSQKNLEKELTSFHWFNKQF